MYEGGKKLLKLWIVKPAFDKPKTNEKEKTAPQKNMPLTTLT
jgi:hypothetical protein